MTLKQPTVISNHVLIVGGVSLGLVDAFVLGNAWLAHPSWNLYMLAIPVAQCALVAAWAGDSKANLEMRFAATLAVMLVSWKIVQHLSAHSFESVLMALWMLALIWVVSIVVVGTQANRIREESTNSDEVWKNYVRVDLKTMMMVTLAAGLAFAFIQFGRVHWRWSVDDLRSREILIFNLLGLLTGIQSLTCLGALAATRFRQRLFRVALHLIGLIAYSLLFSYCVTPNSLAASAQETLALWLSSNVLIISVVMVGRWLSTKSSTESSH